MNAKEDRVFLPWLNPQQFLPCQAPTDQKRRPETRCSKKIDASKRENISKATANAAAPFARRQHRSDEHKMVCRRRGSA